MELRQLIEILLRRKWIIIYVFLSIFGTIVLGSLLIQPTYDATAKVFLQRSTASSTLLSSLGLQGGNPASVSYSDTDRADYLALAEVSTVADKVIEQEQITRERTRAKLMRKLPFLKPLFRAAGVDVEDTTQVMKAEDLINRSLLAAFFPRPYVSIDQEGTTNLISFKAIHTDPEKAQRIANAMARAYVQNEVERIRGDYTGAREFINANIKHYKNEYIGALQELKGFKERETTVNLDSESTNLIAKISDLRKTHEDIRLAIAKAKSSNLNIEAQLRGMPRYRKESEQLQTNSVLLSMKATLKDLYLALAESKTKYTNDHPAVIDIENKIREEKRMIQEEAEKVFGTETITTDPVYRDLSAKAASNFADLAGYEAQDSALPVVIGKYRDEMMQLPRKVYEHSQLNLAVTAAQDIYNSLLKYSYQVGIAESIAVANIYIVDNAKLPDSNHKSPRIGLNGMLAILLGVIFGIGSAFVMEYLDDSVKTADDLKALKVATFLGRIVKLKKKEMKLIDEVEPRSPLREAFRTMRNSIRFATLDKPVKRLLVTSTVQGEGKSFVAANLAISSVAEGKKVLLVDGDMRRPSVHSYFGLDNKTGLTNYLAGDVDMESIQRRTRIDSLHLITTGPIPPDPAKLVESRKMHRLLEQLGASFDLVIVDSPPVLAASDALVLGGWTDGVIVIVESEKTSRKHFTDVMDSLQKANINVIGVVLNKVEGSESSYYYKYYRE